MILKWKFKEAVYEDDICFIDSEWEAVAETTCRWAFRFSKSETWLSHTPNVVCIQLCPVRGIRPSSTARTMCLCHYVVGKVLRSDDLPCKNSYQLSIGKVKKPDKMGRNDRTGLLRHRDWWNNSDRIKTCPSFTLSTTKPTWNSLGFNLDLQGEDTGD